MKILILQLKAIGDVLCTTPIPAYLKKVFPDAEVDFLVNSIPAPVLETSPFINNVLIYNAKDPRGEIQRVRSRKYDAVLDFLDNPRTRILTLLSGAQWKVGFRHGFWKSRFYNTRIPVPVQPEYVPLRKIRMVDGWLEKMGVSPRTPDFIRARIVLTKEDKDFANEWVLQQKLNGKPFVIIMPVHKHAICRWRPEGFQNVASRLVKELGIRVFFGWGPGEEAEIEKIRRGYEEEIGLCPPVSLRKNAAILEKAAFLLANNSGSMHLAVSVGTPTATIYGPTRAVDWNPSTSKLTDNGKDSILQVEDLACLGCRLKECPIGHLCMTQLPEQQVFLACKNLLSKTTA